MEQIRSENRGRTVLCDSPTFDSRDICENNKNQDGRSLAGIHLAPSYLSFDYALYVYDLIPEAIFAFTSATLGKGKRNFFIDGQRKFLYRDVPEAVFSKGILRRGRDENEYLIATPEKALCDKLYAMPQVETAESMEIMLFDDLRVDEDDFRGLSRKKILEYAPLYGCSNLDCLARLIR